TFALADPDNGSGAPQFDHVISGLTWVGTSELVFSANNNLWSIPSSCWATPTNTTATPITSNCTFPASAHPLTTDGNSTTPDTQPSWTSSTAMILAAGGAGTTGG